MARRWESLDKNLVTLRLESALNLYSQTLDHGAVM